MKIFSILLLSLAIYSNAGATLVSGSLEGEVTSADADNIFGLDVGDTITLDITFDDTGFTGTGFETVSFNLPSNTMLFTVGTQTYDDTQDTAGGVGPQVAFFDGEIQEIKFDTQFGTFGIFFSSINFFQGSDDDFLSINGDWDLSSYTSDFTPIPVPAAVWLFASGLLGLVAIGRRRML